MELSKTTKKEDKASIDFYKRYFSIELDKWSFIVQVASAGFDAGCFARITLDDFPVDIQKNENNHYRGFHIVIMNAETGQIVHKRVFDTYKSSDSFEAFLALQDL